MDGNRTGRLSFDTTCDNYDRYRLEFNNTSRSNFRLLCRLANSRKVIQLDESIDLYNQLIIVDIHLLFVLF